MEIISLKNVSINHALRVRGIMRGDLTITHRALMSLYKNFENFIKNQVLGVWIAKKINFFNS